MERNLNHDEFDQFLKDNADGLRMHPSDRVWQNISRELDRKKRRFSGLFALALLVVSGAYITYEVASSSAHHLSYTHQQPGTATTAQLRPAAPIATSKPATNYQPVATAKTAIPGNIPTRKRKILAQQTIRTVLPASIQLLSNAPIETEEPTLAINRTLEAAERTQLPTPELQPVVAGTLSSAVPAPDPVVKAEVAARSISSKLSWQLFITPTISYRVLSDNKSYRRPILTTAIPANFSALYGINDAVIHKPDVGIEFGIMGRYPLGKNVSLRTGFQFNVSRFDIKAFSYVPEVATIALNNGPRVDSVRAISNYRNFSGGRTNWLQNFYFQASMPIGLELKVAGNNKVHWGVASSIQPTYLIGNRSYMITADYKNYARVPWLSRRWNMNTSLETFVSINSGKTQWQVGPQVRYQVLSSFIREYPVKENLFDFGLKVGVTLK